MGSVSVDDCYIRLVPKPRNGRTKYWCFSHNSSATARFGGRMPRCEGAYRTIADFRRFKLDPNEFPGGVALWGAVEPVYNTAEEPADRGIHVHARKRAGMKKEIDQTFDAVELTVKADLFTEKPVLITAETAVAYYISRFLGRSIKGLFCPNCQTPHLDSDWFAVKPHRTHLCHRCNTLFREEKKHISNPLEIIRHELRGFAAPVEPKRAKTVLDVSQASYPAGMQIWASNPALLWTSTRKEEEGIHVHAWKKAGAMPVVDGTFAKVRIDGIELDERQLRVFMAQNALIYLRNKVVCIRCPNCQSPLFDDGEQAFRPKSKHVCQECGADFDTPGRRRLVVSNPFVETIKELKRAKHAKGG